MERTGRKMDQQEIDKALHDCMTTIWKAYRSGDVKTYNKCFSELYGKYDDSVIECFIQGMGMGLAPAVNRRAHENKNM